MQLHERIEGGMGYGTTGPGRGFFRIYEFDHLVEFGLRQINTREYPRLMKLRGILIKDFYPINS